MRVDCWHDSNDQQVSKPPAPFLTSCPVQIPLRFVVQAAQEETARLQQQTEVHEGAEGQRESDSEEEGLSEFGGLEGSDSENEQGTSGGGKQAGCEQQGRNGLPAGSTKDSVKAIQGLGMRLRLCLRFGLMHGSGVFKVYSPQPAG